MKGLYEIKDMLCYELEEIANKGELTAGTLDTVHKLTDTIKNIDKIEMLEEYEDEYSADDDYAYARNGRGRGRNAKRDSMGRYSRDGYSREGGYNMGRGNYGGMMYSRDDGREHLMHDIREMMADAKDEKQREAYHRAMKELENL